MIIDSHTHLSYVGENKKSFIEIKKELLASMKKYGIGYSVVIPDNVPNPQCADMKTLAEVIEDEKQFFSMGTINIFAGLNEQIKELEHLIIAKKICAIKLFPGHDPFYPTDERCQPVYDLCLKYDIPVVFHTGANTGNLECAKYNDPKYLVEIAKKYKKIKIVIAHYFWPKMEYCYELTKDLKNIYYDTSAMADPEVVEASGGWDKVLQILKKTVLKKPSNVLFGTDWPMCPMEKHLQMIKDLQLDSRTEEKIFYYNAVRVYKLRIL
jgi:predicted TIM-barrel fold metal-dependent hydrolase